MFIFLPAALAALSGCFGGAAPKAPAHWTVEPQAASVERSVAPRRAAVRVAGVTVRAPYDGMRLAVMRRGGSLASDPCNSFAASPAAILRGAAQDVVEASGVFAGVVAANSSASVPLALEVTVRRLALDCRVEGARSALVELTAVLVGGGREVVATARGEASIPAISGDYSAAFSSAFSSALAEALKRL